MQEIYAVNYTSERESMKKAERIDNGMLPADPTHSRYSNLTYTSSFCTTSQFSNTDILRKMRDFASKIEVVTPPTVWMDSKQKLSQLSFFQLSPVRMILMVSFPQHRMLTTWKE